MYLPGFLFSPYLSSCLPTSQLLSLSFCLYTCLALCSPSYLPIYLSACLPASVSLLPYLVALLHICSPSLLNYLPTSLFLFSSSGLLVYISTLCLSYLPAYLPLSLPICLSACLHACLSLAIFPSDCLLVSLVLCLSPHFSTSGLG